MLRFLKRRAANIKLGRWDTNKTSVAEMRLADLANCDSCGTCGLSNCNKHYLHIGDDVIVIEPDILLNSVPFNKHR